MQDADYIASLQVDKQKELNSLNKSETHSSKQEEKHKNTLERTVMHWLSCTVTFPTVS
jgi:hypothetical protein